MFTTTERKHLLHLLSKAVRPDDALNLEELHGFLSGLAIIPEVIKPSQWLPIVFGDEMPEFESEAEAEEGMGYLFRVCNKLYKENVEGRLCSSL